VNRLVRVLTVAGLLAVGGVAIATAPSDDTIVAPFLVRGEIGKPIGSRLATVVVSDVGVARELDLSYAYDPDFGEPAPDTASAGVWIVVSLDVTATYTSIDFGNAEVRIAGVRYRASTVLPDPDLPTFAFDPGVTVRGSIVFELPADAVRSAGAARADLVFLPRLVPALDTVATVRVDLRTLPVDDVAVVEGAHAVDGRAGRDG